MKNNENTIYNYITSDSTIIVLIVFALLAQTPTAAYFFHKIQVLIKPNFPNELNWFLGVCYAVVGETAMFIWTLKGKTLYARVYCAISIAINLTQLFDVNNISFFTTFGGILVSTVLPLSIVLFSEEFAKKIVVKEHKFYKRSADGKYIILKKPDEDE